MSRSKSRSLPPRSRSHLKMITTIVSSLGCNFIMIVGFQSNEALNVITQRWCVTFKTSSLLDVLSVTSPCMIGLKTNMPQCSPLNDDMSTSRPGPYLLGQGHTQVSYLITIGVRLVILPRTIGIQKPFARNVHHTKVVYAFKTQVHISKIKVTHKGHILYDLFELLCHAGSYSRTTLHSLNQHVEATHCIEVLGHGLEKSRSYLEVNHPYVHIEVEAFLQGHCHDSSCSVHF